MRQAGGRASSLGGNVQGVQAPWGRKGVKGCRHEWDEKGGQVAGGPSRGSRNWGRGEQVAGGMGITGGEDRNVQAL